MFIQEAVQIEVQPTLVIERPLETVVRSPE